MVFACFYQRRERRRFYHDLGLSRVAPTVMKVSYGIKLATDINNPTLVKLRDIRLKYMFEEMKKDPAIKLQLASSYASIANYWKFYDGETKQLLKYDVYGQKKKAEEKFIAWAKGKPNMRIFLPNGAKPMMHGENMPNTGCISMKVFLVHRLMLLQPHLIQVETALVKPGSTKADIKKAIDAANKARTAFLEEENKISDQNIVAAVTMMFYKDVPKDQHPVGFYGTLKNQYGPLDDEATYKKYAADIFSKTMIFDDAKWNAFVANPDANVLQADPAFTYASAFYNNYNSKYVPYFQQFTAKNAELGRLYLKGIMEMDTVKAKMMYPDATFTMRVSYGAVKSYRPRDAVFYDYVTTSKGILEKYKPGDYEFDLPAKQIEMLKKKDFGQYIDPTAKRPGDWFYYYQ